MPKLIKNYKCFDNQLESAEEAINYFFASNNYSHVVLAAQTQQGKTGTGIATIEKYLTSINNKKVLYLFNHSDNDSADDIQSDLSDAGYYNEKSKTNPVEFFKLGSGERGFESLTKSLENNSNIIEKIGLVIIDEGHYAIGKNRQFHNIMKLLGINLGQSSFHWENKNIKILTLSATAFPQINQMQYGEQNGIHPACTVVTMKETSEYLSLEKIKNKNRLFECFYYLDEHGEITDDFEGVLEKFHDDCKKNGNKHLILRHSVDGTNDIPAIVKYRNKNYPNTHIRIFHNDAMKKDNNVQGVSWHTLDKLNSIISSKPTSEVIEFFEDAESCPNIIIIYLALSMSKTLDTVEYIGGWCEPKLKISKKNKKPRSRNTDTIIQSIGRNCGYQQDRHSAVYPIYCDLGEVDKYINMFKNNFNISEINQRHLNNSKTRTSYIWEIKGIFDTRDECNIWIENFCRNYSIIDDLKDKPYPSFIDYIPRTVSVSSKELKEMFERVDPGLRTCSLNKLDVAKEVVHATGFQQKREGSPFLIRYMDGPSSVEKSDEKDNSWKEYLKTYNFNEENYKPKYILFMSMKEKDILAKDRISDSCLFSEMS